MRRAGIARRRSAALSVGPRRRARAAFWHVLVAIALLLVVCAVATGAATPDTDFTPTPKDGRDLGWTMFDGALFSKHDGTMVGQEPGSKAAPSQTPFTVDFFSVRFDPDPEKSDGYAAGAACADASTPFDKLAGCARVPALWQFTGQ